MKKKLCTLLLALLLALCLPVTALAGENLVQNGDFSQLDESGLPVGWTYAAWTMDDEASAYWTEENDGGTCVRLENFLRNDARLEQEVPVKGNSLYHISARMKAAGGDPICIGGNLSVTGSLAVSGDYTDTDGQWVDVELYGKTGLFQNSITVALRVGFYGEENLGTAWFDDVVVERVDEVPAGFEIQSLKDAPVSASASEEETEGADWVPTQTFIACVFALLLIIAVYRLRGVQADDKLSKQILAILLTAAAALRLYLAAANPGYDVDVNCFTAWGQMVAKYGPADFYAQGFCDYPPGYLYVLGLQGLIAGALNLAPGSTAYLVLLKLPAITCDVAISYLLYRIGRRYGKSTWALLAAAAWAFMPAAILDSAMWGQMDAVLVLLMLLVLDAFLQRKPDIAAIWYAVALMVKPQALMLGVILLGGYVIEIREDPKRGFLRLLRGIGLCLGLSAVIALPFLIKQPIGYIFEKYLSTLTSYPYATVNALNLFYIAGGNWVAQETAVLGLSYSAWGTIGMAVSVALALILMFKSGKLRAVPLCTALMLAGVFCLGVRMHERYMFPRLVLLLLAALLCGDTRLWWRTAGFSATNAVNIYIVLQNTHVLSENRYIGIAAAVVNLLLFFYLIEISMDLCWRGAVQEADPEGVRRPPLRRQVLGARLPDAKVAGDRASFRMKRVDYILMAALTLVYAVTAFYQLGDFTAPQTLWTGNEGDSAVIDLGQAQDVSEVRYYGEIPYGDFTISFSDDGVSWSGEVAQSVGVHDMFKWHSAQVQTSARYVRLTVTNSQIKLFEVAVFGEGDELLPVASCTAPELTDEQAIVPAQMSYMNGMYFDEVYHGRTAYEQNHNMEWYENTHPPLGKVFISWSIQAFGMTPFGWRFAGTLAGVLMVPAMYLLCKLLFRKPLYATFGAFLFTFDFMHLAQTRLGTIDSYPVLFIILGFYFMLRYAYMSFYHDKLWKTFVPLFFSGLFMGLGMASKWIGCYAAVGLAVLFFTIFYARCKEYREAKADLAVENLSAERRAQAQHIVGKFPRCALWTLLACCLFFVVIPIAIYIGSYYQFLRIDAPGHGLKEVWNYQLHMLNYHKGVFESHPFQSSWYQWPLDIRNIWYYVSDSMPEGWVSSISALGSPAVWWTGFACLIWVIVRLVLGYGKHDRRYWWVLIGFAANYLPWVLVPRITFVYHYFASVPFIVLATVLFFEDLCDKKKWGKTALLGLMVVVGVLYALFYPVLTGIPMTEFHASLLKWLPSWTLY